MQALHKNDISLKETLKRDQVKKIEDSKFQGIEKYFGMLKGKLGTMEDIDNYIENDRREEPL